MPNDDWASLWAYPAPPPSTRTGGKWRHRPSHRRHPSIAGRLFPSPKSAKNFAETRAREGSGASVRLVLLGCAWTASGGPRQPDAPGYRLRPIAFADAFPVADGHAKTQSAD